MPKLAYTLGLDLGLPLAGPDAASPQALPRIINTIGMEINNPVNALWIDVGLTPKSRYSYDKQMN